MLASFIRERHKREGRKQGREQERARIKRKIETLPKDVQDQVRAIVEVEVEEKERE